MLGPGTLSAEALSQQRRVGSSPRKANAAEAGAAGERGSVSRGLVALGPKPGTCLLQSPVAADQGTPTWSEPQAHRPIGQLL